jgi:hypothetical protein
MVVSGDRIAHRCGFEHFSDAGQSPLHGDAKGGTMARYGKTKGRTEKKDQYSFTGCAARLGCLSTFAARAASA